MRDRLPIQMIYTLYVYTLTNSTELYSLWFELESRAITLVELALVWPYQMANDPEINPTSARLEHKHNRETTEQGEMDRRAVAEERDTM